MQKNFRTSLSEEDLEKWMKQLKNWDKLMDIAARAIVDDLANFGLKKMKNIYNNNNFTTSAPMDFSITGTEYEKTVAMSGEQALYEEFGTGTMGEENPHPLKGDFNLNPYNSGKTIRPVSNKLAKETPFKEGELYWTYHDSTGQKVYTQGIPAHKEVYDSLQATIKKAPSVVKKRTEQVFKEE